MTGRRCLLPTQSNCTGLSAKRCLQLARVAPSSGRACSHLYTPLTPFPPLCAQVTLKDRGVVLDISQAGGVDTSWAQLYTALRSGWTDAALVAAERCTDATLPRPGPSSMRPYVEEWLRDREGFRQQHAAHLVKECDRLVQVSQRPGGLPDLTTTITFQNCVHSCLF